MEFFKSNFLKNPQWFQTSEHRSMKTAKCCQQWPPVLRRRRRWPCPSGGICHPQRTPGCHNPRLWGPQRGGQPRSTWALRVVTCPQGSCRNSGNVCLPNKPLSVWSPFLKPSCPRCILPAVLGLDRAGRRGSQEVSGWLSVGVAPGELPETVLTTATWLSLTSTHRACAVRFGWKYNPSKPPKPSKQASVKFA